MSHDLHDSGAEHSVEEVPESTHPFVFEEGEIQIAYPIGIIPESARAHKRISVIFIAEVERSWLLSL